MRTSIVAILVIAVSLSAAMAADFPVVDSDRQASEAKRSFMRDSFDRLGIAQD